MFKPSLPKSAIPGIQVQQESMLAEKERFDRTGASSTLKGAPNIKTELGKNLILRRERRATSYDRMKGVVVI